MTRGARPGGPDVVQRRDTAARADRSPGVSASCRHAPCCRVGLDCRLAKARRGGAEGQLGFCPRDRNARWQRRSASVRIPRQRTAVGCRRIDAPHPGRSLPRSGADVRFPGAVSGSPAGDLRSVLHLNADSLTARRFDCGRVGSFGATGRLGRPLPMLLWPAFSGRCVLARDRLMCLRGRTQWRQ